VRAEETDADKKRQLSFHVFVNQLNLFGGNLSIGVLFIFPPGSATSPAAKGKPFLR